MGKNFEETREELHKRIYHIYSTEELTSDFERDFMNLVDKVNFYLIQEKHSFYGHFLLKMERKIKYDISTPTASNFKNSKYIIYFNPMIFLGLTLEQMGDCIKHEIHHILALHLIRAKELKGKVSPLAINMAMDIVVNQHLEYLPPYAATLSWVNMKYKLDMKPFNNFEYYAYHIQSKLDLLGEREKEEDKENNEEFAKEFSPFKTHDMWEKSEDIEDKTLKEFTLKFAMEALKGENSPHIESFLKDLREDQGEIPWNLYLKKLMGTIEGDRKKTITRRNRRQPNRLDLRGELRGHTAHITLALDISASISNEEFEQALKEVLNIVKSYKHEITVIECDSDIKNIYKIKNSRDLRERSHSNGGTKFSPVFEQVNKTNTNILIYFTDGEGEKKLEVVPKEYKTLWIISGHGQKLSLQKPFGMIKKLKAVEIKNDNIDMEDVRSDGWSMNHQQPDL